MFIYIIIGIVVATIALLITLPHADTDEKLFKAKQLGVWTFGFILATLLWPLVVIFVLMSLTTL